MREGKRAVAAAVCLLVGLMSQTAQASGLTGETEAAAALESENTAAERGPSIEGEWVGDGEDWQYLLPDGTYLEKSWLRDQGKWYYFSRDGYMEHGVQHIGPDYYFFGGNGVMATGWAYDGDEDIWYYAKEDGALKKGWHQGGDAWYWFDSRGEMYCKGFRMVSGHKYYFYENGQMAANQYVELNYYDENGLRDREHDVTIQGKRKPSAEEKERITASMAGIPREWIRRFTEDGWELMFYTDKSYFSAPATEQGIYYVRYDVDPTYRKIKFTNPDCLAMAFGEFAAEWLGRSQAERLLLELEDHVEDSGLVQPLPGYFDEKPEMVFGHLFEGLCQEEVRRTIREESPERYRLLQTELGFDREGQRPGEEEELLMDDDPLAASDGSGPASDPDVGRKTGPAGEGKES